MVSSNNYTIIAVGPAGVGKSTLLNSIVGADVFKASMTTDGGETKEIAMYEGKWLGQGSPNIKIIDTPGMGDPDLPLDELCKDIDIKCQGQKIDIVMICVKANDYRKDLKQIMAIEFITEFVQMLKRENIVMVMTHCDQAKPDDKYLREKVQSYN